MMKKEDMVGVYRQLGEEVVDAARQDDPLGQQPQLADHVQPRRLCRRWSARRPSARRLAAPAGRTDLNGATAGGAAPRRRRRLTCYAGHYELKDGSVFHHIEMALNPNLIGQTLIRRVHIDGADLTLSALPDKDGNYRRIQWRRVPGK